MIVRGEGVLSLQLEIPLESDPLEHLKLTPGGLNLVDRGTDFFSSLFYAEGYARITVSNTRPAGTHGTLTHYLYAYPKPIFQGMQKLFLRSPIGTARQGGLEGYAPPLVIAQGAWGPLAGSNPPPERGLGG